MAAGDITQGRRTDVPLHEMEPGDYGLTAAWLCVTPNGSGGNLSRHDVTVHPDRTITVSPSILISRGSERDWHGYLEHGVWREV